MVTKRSPLGPEPREADPLRSSETGLRLKERDERVEITYSSAAWMQLRAIFIKDPLAFNLCILRHTGRRGNKQRKREPGREHVLQYTILLPAKLFARLCVTNLAARNAPTLAIPGTFRPERLPQQSPWKCANLDPDSALSDDGIVDPYTSPMIPMLV